MSYGRQLLACAFLAVGGGCQVSHPSHPSNYPQLSARAQCRVQPYTARARPDSVVQELTAADVRALSRAHAYTWVVTWAPWCEPWHGYAEQFKDYQRRLADRDINLVFVDIDYSPATALGAHDALRGNRPAYVINGRAYGPNADVQFRQQVLGAEHLPKRLRYSSHFLLNQQQQVVMTSPVPDLSFERLETATVAHTSRR